MGETAPIVAQEMVRDNVEDFREVSVGTSQLANILQIACCPLAFVQGWWILQPREEAISLHFGQLTGRYTNPGCQYTNPCGLELRRISVAQISTLLNTQRVLDKSGNPVVVSAIIVYRFVDPGKALLNVDRPSWFVETQSAAVVKDVVSRFTYVTNFLVAYLTALKKKLTYCSINRQV